MTNQLGRLEDPLLGKMWKTKSSRFNAHGRLKTKHWLSTTATSILSFYLVIVALIPLAYETSVPLASSKFLAVVSLLLSIFLIIITLLESAKNYLGDAEKMHKCALDISELYNRFQAMGDDDRRLHRVAINDEYSAILKTHEVNHNDIDFLRFRLAFRDDLQISGFELVFSVIKYAVLWMAEYWLYIILLILPLVLAVRYGSFVFG